jgi:lysine-ketoglutarate reductase/saccharopine dehydrogenase-like protein (TIGR00300 family)
MNAGHDKFLMCPPTFYQVEYVINPWMEGNIGRSDRTRSSEQWTNLRRVLERHAAVEIVEPGARLPDMPFTANAGLVADDIFIPARCRFPQRQPEAMYFVEWFRRRGYRLAELPGESSFEGEGDALFQPGEPLLWGGYGVRTSLLAHRHLAELLHVEVVPLRLVDQRFYHLDTCFCPLPEGRVLFYPGAFDARSIETIASRVEERDRFEAPPVDALHFACNAVVCGRTFITNFASQALRERLLSWGYEVVECPLSEFILAGGAAKCLALFLSHRVPARAKAATPRSDIRDRLIELHGHLLDTGFMNRVLDCISDAGGSFEIESFQPGLRHDQNSEARVRVVAPSADRLDRLLGRLIELGVQIAEVESDARLEVVSQPGVAPQDFYSTTIFPTDARLRGKWVRAQRQRMDAVLVVGGSPEAPGVTCRLLRDLQVGDRVVCGIEGVRVHATRRVAARDAFEFMSADTSSERRVELMVERTAWEMRRLRERAGRIIVVAGPVVVHTGGIPHLARLIRRGYVQGLLGGNGLATHDIELALFGTSLGIDLKRGTSVPGGHQNHLRAINLVRACGGIAQAVEQGRIQSGVMYECVRQRVPFVLAGSIRDDGPLPETLMDLIVAQREYARLIEGADLMLMLSSMLHSIGVGNMTPAGVRIICVDISPAAVTKLADRGSVESTGIVTDVGLFLNLLDAQLGEEHERAITNASAFATD